MKLKYALLPFIFLLSISLIIPRTSFAAESCSLEANVGTDPNGGSDYRVNVRINTSSLNQGESYTLIQEFAGRTVTNVSTFTPNSGGDQQISFNASPPGCVLGSCPTLAHYSIRSSNGNRIICSSNEIDFATASTPNTNDNLPDHPVPEGISTCDTASGEQMRDGDGIFTAIGCIPYDPVGLTKFFLGWALGIGGGIALLMIGFAGISIMTSAGDPKKMQGGQQLMTAAISGLLLIIFSTFILRFFGVTLFGIF